MKQESEGRYSEERVEEADEAVKSGDELWVWFDKLVQGVEVWGLLQIQPPLLPGPPYAPL